MAKKIVVCIIIIVLDLAIYIFLGLLLMEYDDFYESSKGEYFSLASMTVRQKVVWITYNIWIWLNLLAIVCLLFLLLKKGIKWRKSQLLLNK
jgi:hypothetical protein